MRKRLSRGFTLIELMVVITIIGLLASIASVAVLNKLKTAKIETSKTSMRSIKQAISMFYMRKNRVPNELSELCGPEGDEKRELEMEEPPKDGWGNDFLYTARDKKNYDLTCLGSDGVEGGEDDAKDITLADLTKRQTEDER